MSEKKKWFEKSSLFQKLKNIKHIEIIIAVIFAIIIMLIYLSSLGSTKTTSSNQTDLESRLCSILEDLEGVGEVSVLINYLDEEETKAGIVVVASGADDISVRLQILKAVETVLNLPTTNIEILVGNK